MRGYCTNLVKEGTNFHCHHLLVQIKRPLRNHDYILKVAKAVFIVMMKFISYTSLVIIFLNKLRALITTNIF